MRTIHNTSFIINEGIEKSWVDFMQQHYIGTIRKSGLCKDIIFTKVSIDQPEGKTYSLQLVFGSEAGQEHFFHTLLPELEERLICSYSGQYFCFSSTLTEI